MNTLDTVTSARVSRRTLLKGAGAAGAGLALAQAGLLTADAADAAQAESIQDILDTTVTVESFGVTILGAALESNRQGNFSPRIADPVVAILTAARAQEQFHLEFFQGLGGRMLTRTFTVPDPALLTNPTVFFDALQAQESREVAAQIAAFKTFTALGRSDLVKVSFQYAAEEAEHRLLANFAAGARPALDLAFAPALFNTAGEILVAMRQVGLIGGSGTAATYPGPGTIDPSNVTNRTPDGPAVSCAGAPGMPRTGGGGGRQPQDLLGLLGLVGLGAAAAGALSRRLAAQTPAQARAGDESGGERG